MNETKIPNQASLWARCFLNLNCSKMYFLCQQGSIISTYGCSTLSRILWCTWTPVQPKLLLPSLLSQCCRHTAGCRSCEWSRERGTVRSSSLGLLPVLLSWFDCKGFTKLKGYCSYLGIQCYVFVDGQTFVVSEILHNLPVVKSITKITDSCMQLQHVSLLIKVQKGEV